MAQLIKNRRKCRIRRNLRRKLNDVCLIVHGYANNPEQFYNDIKDYHSFFNKIVISTYSNSIPIGSDISNFAQIYLNDKSSDDTRNGTIIHDTKNNLKVHFNEIIY
jgi:hypothetical protein